MLHTYDRQSQRWAPFAPSDDPMTALPSALPRGLQVLTYNLWSDAETYPKPRCHAALALIARLGPDVLCLQEVVDDSLALFHRSGFIRANYASTTLALQRRAFEGSSTACNRQEGVVLLVRKTWLPWVHASSFHPFLDLTQQGRCGVSLTLKDRRGRPIVRPQADS
jgi:endonuclease/exonuclease/phosphatase family metal-dependent hydrolase